MKTTSIRIFIHKIFFFFNVKVLISFFFTFIKILGYKTLSLKLYNTNNHEITLRKTFKNMFDVYLAYYNFILIF